MSALHIAGANKDEVSRSPYLEQLLKKGYEVVYFTDVMDEYMMQVWNLFIGICRCMIWSNHEGAGKCFSSGILVTSEDHCRAPQIAQGCMYRLWMQLLRQLHANYHAFVLSCSPTAKIINPHNWDIL
jgi:hypothetical protein